VSATPDEVRTIAAPHRYERLVKKSRFLAQAARVDSPERAMEILAGLSDRQATHNCFAYRIGQQYRFSDDGEPGGTAGRPILAAIEGRELDRVLVVVTRWYGGIKLGAGGLARAYGGSAAECLRQAPQCVLRRRVQVLVAAPFADLGAVYHVLERSELDKLGEDYEPAGVALSLELEERALEDLARALADATSGRVVPRVCGDTLG
jgi:uncharacterized YigZ family protein